MKFQILLGHFQYKLVLSKSTANLKKKLKDGAYMGKTRSQIMKRKSSLQITDEQSSKAIRQA